MDELTPLGENLDHPFGESFNSILDEAHRQLLNEAPIHLLPVTDVSEETVAYDLTNDFAYVQVPDNFIRIASFKFSGWTNPATKFISQEHPEYKNIEHGLITKNVIKPIVVLEYSLQAAISVTPKRYLKCYSVEKATGVDPVRWLYVISEGDVSLLIDKTADALIWLSASKLMQAFEIPGYKLADDRYKEFLISNAR